MSSNDTRDKIMDTAINMFNTGSASGTSTVQIANQMGISPSNLYYYFDNKEHLIREIWSERIAPQVGALFYKSDVKVSENGILKFFIKFAAYSQKYSFFYREIYVILSNDPVLHKMYSDRAEVLLNQILVFMDSWVEIGIMHEVNLVEKTLLAETAWTLAQTWTAYSGILHSGIPSESISVDAVIHLYTVFRPYFTNEANARILKLFEMSEYKDSTPLAQKCFEILVDNRREAAHPMK